jgi:hypothetical protein
LRIMVAPSTASEQFSNKRKFKRGKTYISSVARASPVRAFPSRQLGHPACRVL